MFLLSDRDGVDVSEPRRVVEEQVEVVCVLDEEEVASLLRVLVEEERVLCIGRRGCCCSC